MLDNDFLKEASTTTLRCGFSIIRNTYRYRFSVITFTRINSYQIWWRWRWRWRRCVFFVNWGRVYRDIIDIDDQSNSRLNCHSWLRRLGNYFYFLTPGKLHPYMIWYSEWLRVHVLNLGRPQHSKKNLFHPLTWFSHRPSSSSSSPLNMSTPRRSPSPAIQAPRQHVNFLSPLATSTILLHSVYGTRMGRLSVAPLVLKDVGIFRRYGATAVYLSWPIIIVETECPPSPLTVTVACVAALFVPPPDPSLSDEPSPYRMRMILVISAKPVLESCPHWWNI